MPIDNYPQASDWANMRDNFLVSLGYSARTARFHKFQAFASNGTGIEQFRTPVFISRNVVLWLSQVKVFDTVKAGYFTTGDLEVNTSFQIRGYSASFQLPGGSSVEEYAGDQIIWNGKIWIVSDQIEPVPFGPGTGIIYWRTVLRRMDRSGQGLSPGAK